MRLNLRLGPRGLIPAAALIAGLLAPRGSSADVITINDGATPGTTDIPFTCAIGTDNPIWQPYMGFVYRNVEAFELIPGDTISFDIQSGAGFSGDLGFAPQLDIALAHAPNSASPFVPADLGAGDFTVVADNGIAASRGNLLVEDYDLEYRVDRPFKFPGGVLIIRVSEPRGVLATKNENDCLPVISADRQPNGVNRLVGTFKLDLNGEYPWVPAENTMAGADVPYVRIAWTRCGDGRVTGGEVCDDGNTDDTDDCSNLCLAPACGDGIVQRIEECDNSANVDSPDPFCNDDCTVTVFAKGSGCASGRSVGLVVMLALFGLVVLRRRGAGAAVVLVVLAGAGSARAQAPMRQLDGFRVDRFEMAPSVEDALVVQDPGVLPHMVWSINATLGFTNTILRVVPRLSTDEGIDVVGPRLSAYLDFAMGFGDRVEVNASMPFSLAQSSEAGTAAGIMLREAAGSAAVGDGRLGASVLIYGRKTGPQVGLAGGVLLPLGSEDSFTGDGGVGGEMMATGGYVAPRYRVIANAGVRLRPEADYITSDQGTEMVGRAAVVVPFVNNRLHSSLELEMISRTANAPEYRELGWEMRSPILALVGARYHFKGGVRAGAGVGMGLTEAPGSPAVRGLVTVGYSPEPQVKPIRRDPPPPVRADRDDDGIVDNLDQCPDMAEDLDGMADEDGCPDLDDDKDRINDVVPEPTKPLTLQQVITLPAPIEFYFDTAIMRPGADVYLRQVLEVLQNHPEVTKIEIQGHTSSEGGHDYNMGLSNNRAKAVVQWLVDHGIDAGRLVPKGYGLTQPLAPNDSEPNRQKNRRVQFRLIDQPGAAPGGAQPGPQPAGPAGPQPAPATKKP